MMNISACRRMSKLEEDYSKRVEAVKLESAQEAAQKELRLKSEVEL